MPSLFISRELSDNSPFRLLTQDAAWTVAAYALLRFEPIVLVSMPPVDWLFFYSRNGVRFLLSQYQPTADTLLAAMGPATAAALEEAGYTPHFIGTGQPAAVAKAFKQRAAKQRVGFVQAQQSRRSVQHILKNTVQSSNWIVYDNQDAIIKIQLENKLFPKNC